MLGGYQIIDLSGMSVSIGGVVSISDPNVLKQLLTLREHIEENYDYSKPLNKRLKAVMIRLRDAESGEKTEGCLWGNLSIIDDNLSFNIDAVVSVNPLKVLQINVVFEKKQDDDGNDYYDIKSAKYEYKGGEDVVTVTNIKNIPSATINKLDCGDIVLKKDSSGLHAYIVSFRNATGICLTYTDAYCVETQSYDKVGQNWVYNSEDKTILNSLEQIYDKDGRKRFIEGEGTPLSQEGFTASYCKWSLSGTHLMLVLAGTINDEVVIANASLLANFNIPEWILDKIYPIQAQLLEYKSTTCVASNYTNQTLNTYLSKGSNGLRIFSNGTLTLTDTRSFRISFDLLIDNE